MIGRQGTDTGQVGRTRLPRWVAFAAGLLGTVLGIATNLYSQEFRGVVESPGRISSTALSVLVAAVVASGTTAFAYWWIIRRRQHLRITEGVVELKADILRSVEGEQDSVVGRTLHFLEARRGTDDLIVFLHGLGLDANDFRPYMAESRFHCLALTLYGFDATERPDRYPPISLQAHVEVLAYALRKIKKMHPRKRLTIVGFSFGADMIFFLTKYAEEVLADLNLHRVVLLDPNANASTTTISGRIAKVTEDRQLDELVGILKSASDVTEFRYLCEYLYKITAKNFAQIRRHATDVVAMWQGESHEQFLNYIGQLGKHCGGLHVVFSYNYERLFNSIAHGAEVRGLDIDSFQCATSDHFELIGPMFLKQQLEGVV